MNTKSPHQTHSEVIDKILTRLAEAEQPLPSSLEFYRRILLIQSKIKLPDFSDISIELEKKAAQRLIQHKPIINFNDLKINWENIQQLFNELTDLAIEFLTPVPEEIDELKQLGADIESLKEISRTWFASKTASRSNGSKNEKVNPLKASILQAAFYPLLAVYADKLLPLVSQDSWYQRYCPICGGSADFSSLDKEKEGARWLLCSRCDSKWLFYRLVCPFCDNHDQHTLAYFTDDTGLYRLYVCEKCHRYLKAIDLRKTESEILLPLERIMTLDLDRQAHDSKYKVE